MVPPRATLEPHAVAVRVKVDARTILIGRFVVGDGVAGPCLVRGCNSFVAKAFFCCGS